MKSISDFTVGADKFTVAASLSGSTNARRLRSVTMGGSTTLRLLVVVAAYCVFSTAEVVVIKALDGMSVVLPVLTCLCENGYWPLHYAAGAHVQQACHGQCTMILVSCNFPIVIRSYLDH